jgi:hypothetical protein
MLPVLVTIDTNTIRASATDTGRVQTAIESSNQLRNGHFLSSQWTEECRQVSESPRARVTYPLNHNPHVFAERLPSKEPTDPHLSPHNCDATVDKLTRSPTQFRAALDSLATRLTSLGRVADLSLICQDLPRSGQEVRHFPIGL